ncbi:MAG: phosphatase PAP2 family protein [Chloroflexi bacterium]|nr:phosphatase PAP2 family protein [Chloroflexota bacterium]MBI3931639.1 phosphatase PAP2 family protein [Chloroflexota bacterium]
MSRLYIGIYAIFLILFGLIGYFAHQLPFFPGDSTISLWLQRITLPFVAWLMVAVSYAGATLPAVVTVTLTAAVLWFSGRKLEPVFIVLLTSLAALLNWLLKLLVSRPRPGHEFIQALGENGGFPSGHTTYAVVFFGFLFYLLAKLVKRPLVVGALRWLLVVLIIFSGVSRVYLGAHWPSDILGSLLLGGLLLAPAIVLYDNYAKSRQKTGG